ncbi:hypothetical protein NE616_00645 [Enterobacteriaceae bacterium DFI.7.85]|nr:hypothetical protein [Enterobacteriaceae bacterium DFI.7.85]
MNKKLHKPDLTDKASARLTTKQLIGAAHHAARYLPKASGELVTELASRLDVTQSALCESLKIRDVLASENGQMLRLLTDISENHGEFVNEEDEYLYASVPLDYVSEVNMYVSRDVNAENPFKETDAFLAEVRAHGRTQGIYFVANRMLAAWEHGFIKRPESEVVDVARMILSSVEMLPDAEEEDFEREFADEMMGVLTDLLRGNSNGGAV